MQWWPFESVTAPDPANPWAGNHPAGGNGSSPHAWGITNANKALLDSLVAQRTDGTLVVGRGVPDTWIGRGKAIDVGNFAENDGKRISVAITSTGTSVTLTLTGQAPSGDILFQLPAFVNNIEHTTAGSADAATGTVTLASTTRSVTVTLPTAAS